MTQTIFLQRTKEGEPKRIAVRCAFSDKERVKKAGSGTARWSKSESVWTVPPDPVLLKRLLKVFPDATILPDLRQYMDKLLDKQNAIYVSSDMSEPISPDSKLFPYQNKSVRILETAGSIILGHRMGLGKTPIACVGLDYVGARKVIIVCPSSVKWSWVDHIIKWAGRTDLYVLESGVVKTDLATVIHKDREDFLHQFLSTEREFVLLMSYDMMRMYKDILCLTDYDVIIFDEAHRLKNRKAATTQAAQEVCKNVEKKWLLTGTPIRNSYVDVFTLLTIIDPVRFGSYWNFVNTYLDTVPNLYGGTDIIGLTSEEEFNSMMSVYMYRLTQEDVYEDLPPTIYSDLKMPMGSKQLGIYSEMEEELLVAFDKELADGKTVSQIVSAPNTVAQLIRLRQICLSPALIGGPEVSAKLDMLSDLVEDLVAQDEKFIIFSYFREFIKLVAELLDSRGIKYGEIVGGQSSSARHKVQGQLTEGEIDVVIGTAQSMGEGMNLQVANTAIFTDIDWVPANNEQAEQRIGHRGGVKKESPRIIRLYHPDTVESDIWATCARKERVISESIGTAETIRAMMLRNGRQ